MNSFVMQGSSASANWLVFLCILLAIGLGITVFAVWFFMFHKSGKRKRKYRHRNHRKVNPTLAETGGLPPLRAPNEPPKGI